ncbi:hypothetical protein N8I77_012788 [Diaporthe amygdali]|uniref:Calcineurin-like phosphoesterase domain-containing protein n=1 Tax=Phomopsis amygdali TaxID=1214568 RepID=A0AAD9S1M3_PHOAM|nr:hypothetical protein N8I77_012788 [Diaporthe amygdali]
MAPASFQVVSDLHLETLPSYEFDIKQTAPNIALLGDIGRVIDDGLFTFLEGLLNKYWNVLFLLGNHEPLGTSWEAAKIRIHAFADKMEELRGRSTIGRFVFLDRTRFDLNNDLTILGCTLFSNIVPRQATDVGDRLMDFKQIHGWTVADHITAHRRDVEWLNQQVCEIKETEPHRSIVIFTHHSPTFDSRAVNPRHASSSVSTGFCSDLTHEACWKSEAVVFWGFGHTHFNCDFVQDYGQRVVANQKGYKECWQDEYDAGKIYIIGRACSSGLLDV